MDSLTMSYIITLQSLQSKIKVVPTPFEELERLDVEELKTRVDSLLSAYNKHIRSIK